MAGYGEFGNNGSVREYFHDVSQGRLSYQTLVAPLYRAQHPSSYYRSGFPVPYPGRAQELVSEVLSHHLAAAFDFSALSVDADGFIKAVNVFYAGTTDTPDGLWPHQKALAAPVEVAPGLFAKDYQVCDMAAELTLSRYCHENGHMICEFPDLYSANHGERGAGDFCIMASGLLLDPKNPPQVCGYLKVLAGWADEVAPLSGTVVSLASGRNEVVVHRRSPTEYFVIENRLSVGRDAALPGSGLAIWHVDQSGSNSNDANTLASHYECALIQADGLKDIEGGRNNGDATDLFHQGGATRFGLAGAIPSNWWDGSASGLEVDAIGPTGSTITFSITF